VRQPSDIMQLASQRATVLALFSGGLDSTAMLYKMLSETHKEESIHVSFIELAGWNNDVRGAAERKAVIDSLKYLQHDFRFTYSTEFYSYQSLA